MNMAKTFVTAERVAELEEENARLREQLRWISVAERLPEKNTLVLVSPVNVRETRMASLSENNRWRTWGGVYGVGWVTHWMPLPEPPQEEGK